MPRDSYTGLRPRWCRPSNGATSLCNWLIGAEDVMSSRTPIGVLADLHRLAQICADSRGCLRIEADGSLHVSWIEKRNIRDSSDFGALTGKFPRNWTVTRAPRHHPIIMKSSELALFCVSRRRPRTLTGIKAEIDGFLDEIFDIRTKRMRFVRLIARIASQTPLLLRKISNPPKTTEIYRNLAW